VLVAIFGEKDSHAVYYLHQQGITRLDVVNFISHGITKVRRRRPAKEEAKSSTEARSRRRPAGSARATPINLNALAQEGKIDPLIGRDPSSSA
jgi:ATP-dependent Clp protease ATP-binding subunit ClpA